MKLNSYLLSDCIATMTSLFSFPVAIFDLDENLIACTRPEVSSLASSIVQQCRTSPYYSQEIATSFHATYSIIDDEAANPLCILVLLDAANRSDLLEPLRSLLLQSLRAQELASQQLPDSDNRVSFIYQLLSSRNIQNDILIKRAAQLNIPVHYARVVIIFSVSPDSESDRIVLTDFSTGEGQQIFLKALASAPGHCEADAGEFMNLNSFSLIKVIPEEYLRDQKTYLTRYLEQILDTMDRSCKLYLRVSVGSCYTELLDLHSSYEEALFLDSNHDFFIADNARTLFIVDHIYDYLSSLLPRDYYQKKFHAFSDIADEHPALKQTLLSLSRHNMNLRVAAADMNLHRNTMLQRYDKIKQQFDIDPAANDSDRINARQYSLYCRKRLTLKVGVIIQSSNVLNLLYRKLSEQIYHNSNGEMDIEIHTLGTSGNNRLLFDLLSNGDLDIACGNPDALTSLIGEQISVLNAPFLFDSAGQALSLLNGEAGEMLFSPLEDCGFIRLAIWSMGWRYFSHTDHLDIKLPSDLQGRRIRIMQKPLIVEWLRYLGAIPMIISYDKILSALDDGLIEMQENPYRNFYEMKFYRYQKRILEMDMLFDSNIVMTTYRAWEQLEPDQREILRRSVNATTQWNRELFMPLTTDCRRKILDKGVDIYQPNQEELSAWQISSRDFLAQSSYADIAAEIEQIKQTYIRSHNG